MVTEPCSFQTLRIPVTEDEAVIRQAFQTMVKNNAILEASTQPLERLKYKQIIEAGSNLNKGKTRREVVDFHMRGFTEFVDQFIGGLGVDITSDNYDFLISQGKAPLYHLSPELAKRVVEDTLQKWGKTVGGSNQPLPAPAAPPTLVAQFKIENERSFPRLRWMRPDTGCERVRILAKYDGFPANDTDGREVFNGLGDDCTDDQAAPGKTRWYAAFSYSGGQSSSPAAARAEHFFAAGVQGLKWVPGPERIEISWDKPAMPYQRTVVFRTPAGSGPGIQFSPGQFPIAMPGTVSLDAGTNTSVTDDRQSTGLVPGKPYDYLVVVDYGSAGSKREYSTGQSFTVTPFAAAAPVADLRLASTPEGMQLSWRTPESLCDKVVVVRSADRQPTSEQEGGSLPIEKLGSCLDRKLNAGATYYYSVFSVYKGYASACVKAAKLYAGPPLNFRATDPVANPGRIRLTWTLPARVKEIKLFRAQGASPRTTESGGEIKIVSGLERTVSPNPAGSFSEQVETGVIYHYHLRALYEDGQWSSPAAASAQALEVARKASPPRMAVTPVGEVGLEWTAPDPGKAGVYAYKVWRRGATATDAAPQLVGTTRETRFLDVALMCGLPYQYAVQSAIGPVDAPLSEWAGIFVTRDVTLKNAIGKNGSVTLQWESPPGTKGVEVRRMHDDVAVNVDLDCAVDEGLENGREYSYTITAVFANTAGQEFRSPGVTASAKPVIPAAPIRGLDVSHSGVAVWLSWILPGSPMDGIVLSRLEKPRSAQVGDLFDLSTIPGAIPLGPSETFYEDRLARIGQIWHYALYTRNGSTATFSGTVQAALFAPVEALTANNQTNAIWLQWKWPKGIEAVRIYRSNSPSGMWERLATVTREQYETNGSVYESKIPEEPARHVFRIQSIQFRSGGTVESLLTAEVEVLGGRLPAITYTVKKKSSQVEVDCDVRKAGNAFGQLVLIRNATREPMSSQEGTTVDLSPRRDGVRAQKSIRLRDADLPADGVGYYRVFLSGADPQRQAVTIKDPPLSERKVEFF